MTDPEKKQSDDLNSKYKNCCTTCKEYFVEFTSNSSLHGLQYIGERGRPLVERIWWTIMFGLSFAACIHLIYQLYIKWDQSPVIVSFAESSTPVYQVPFPAITICSETKSRQSVFNFTDMHYRSKNLTDKQRIEYETISLVCDNHILKTGSETTDAKSIEFLAEVAPKIELMMMTCLWKTTKKNCSKIFTPILTEEGLCFTFNMLNANELFNEEMLQSDYQYLNHENKSEGWTLDGGYPDHLPLETYPVRGTGSGATAGLTVVLRAFKNDLDYLCRGPVQGYRVALHTPVEFPRASQQYFRVPLNQEVIATIKPNMMTTSEGLRGYAPKRRQCYFPNERKLNYFKMYTQQNCELECLADYTKILCECVTFSMPRDNLTEICSAGKVKCASFARDDLLTRGIKSGLTDKVNDELDEFLNEFAADCNCLPACTVIEYDVEISQADYNWKKVYESYKENVSDVELARMVLFFKQSQFITSKRSELYGQTDFLANCGGLLGLCLGFSVLSLIEIIYFLTLRAFCNLTRRFQKKNTTTLDKFD